eukprot:691743-Amphidinium_carterae.1
MQHVDNILTKALVHTSQRSLIGPSRLSTSNVSIISSQLVSLHCFVTVRQRKVLLWSYGMEFLDRHNFRRYLSLLFT